MVNPLYIPEQAIKRDYKEIIKEEDKKEDHSLSYLIAIGG